MTLRQVDNRIAKLEALEAEKKLLEAKIAELKEAIQDEMGDNELMETGKYIIKWTFFIKNSFDSKRFKTDHVKLYNEYVTPQEQRRFSYTIK